MNFEQAFFDELEKIALEAGAYLPGGAASKALAEMREGAANYRRVRDVPSRITGQPQNPKHLAHIEATDLARRKTDWARRAASTPAPSEVTGTRRLQGLANPGLPGAPSLGKRVSGRVGQIAGKIGQIAGGVGAGMGAGIGRVGEGIRTGVGKVRTGLGRVGSFMRGMVR